MVAEFETEANVTSWTHVSAASGGNAMQSENLRCLTVSSTRAVILNS
jgi:hypothetical protein